jgi:hypothetical protein
MYCNLMLSRQTLFAAMLIVLHAVIAPLQAQCGTSVVWHDGGAVRAMLANENYLYVGSANGLRIIDVSGASPVERSSYVLDGDPLLIERAGTHLYVAVGERGVEIINISDPANPVHVNTIAGGNAQDLAVVDARLHILRDGDVRTYDVSNPAIPQFINTYAFGDLRELEARNSIVYAASGTTLYALDYSTPASPFLRDSIAFIRTNARAMDVRPGICAVVNGDNIYLYDISNPSSLSLTATLVAVSDAGFFSQPMCEFGQADGVPVLYYINSFGEIDSVSLANPASPVHMPAFADLSGAEAFAAPPTSRAYIATSEVLYGYEVTLNAGQDLLWEEEIAPIDGNGIYVSGSTLAWAGNDSMLLYDVTNPALPVLASQTAVVGGTNEFRCVGNLAYLLSYDDLLLVYDITSPASPVLLGSDDLRDTQSMDVAGQYLYALTYADELVIFRVNDPSNIRRQSTTLFTGATVNVVVRGEHAFVLCSEQYYIFDIGDPTAPVLRYTSPISQDLGYQDLEVYGDRLITLEGNGRVEALDITNVNSPQLRWWVDSGNNGKLAMSGSLLIVNEYFGDGIDLVDLADPDAPVVLPQTLRRSGVIDHTATIGGIMYATGLNASIDAFDLPGLPRVSQQPQDAGVCQNAPSVQFSVTIAEPAGATYRWRRGGTALNNGTTSWGTTISGVTTATLTLSSPDLQDFGLYDCEITNTCGTINTRDASLVLGVNPVIVILPEDRYVCPSGSATFSVGWIGTTPGTFAWQAELPRGSGTWTTLSDATFPRFAISGATTRFLTLAANPGETFPDVILTNFRCVVTNPCVSTTSTSAALIVCRADFDCSGFVDTDDFTVFVAAFELGTDDADFDETGFVDTDDFTAFVLAFESGC